MEKGGVLSVESIVKVPAFRCKENMSALLCLTHTPIGEMHFVWCVREREKERESVNSESELYCFFLMGEMRVYCTSIINMSTLCYTFYD